MPSTIYLQIPFKNDKANPHSFLNKNIFLLKFNYVSKFITSLLILSPQKQTSLHKMAVKMQQHSKNF
jgi:hypothetical protein